MVSISNAETTPFSPSAPPESEKFSLPGARKAPTFQVDAWNPDDEPVGMTRLRSGESFLDGVKRISERKPNDISCVSKGCSSALPGMRVANDQVGVILKNGAVRLRPDGAYRTTALNPWKTNGAVIPIKRDAGVEFDPVASAAHQNRAIAKRDLGKSFRQIVLQKQQVAVFEDQTSTRTATAGTFVYDPETTMRGVIDLNHMQPVMVERETEDTAAANNAIDGTRINQHGRQVPTHQGHGTTVETTTRVIPAGYVSSVAGITIARPEKGFVAMHKDAENNISLTEGICIAQGNESFVQRAKDEKSVGMRAEDMVIEFGDLNHYAKSTPMLELKSKNNLDALCRAQIKWRQTRPDVWIAQRGAFTDPFDMLEEKCANMMRDWLLSVPHKDALEEKAKGFTKVEHQWTTELNDLAQTYGVEVMGLEITTLRFPIIDKQDEAMADQLAETNLAIDKSRQEGMKEVEINKLNEAKHDREQQDKNRGAEAEERQQEVQRRKDVAEAETKTKKAEMDTKVVEAQKAYELAAENKLKEVAVAKASAEAEAERIRAEGKRDAAQLTAEGEIAATQQKNQAQLSFLQQQAALLKDNPGLVDLLKLQNDLLKTEALATAAKTNPNVVLLTGQEGLEARRMNGGYAPQVPAAALVSTTDHLAANK